MRRVSIWLGSSVPASTSTSKQPQTSTQDFDRLAQMEIKATQEEADLLNKTREALLRVSQLIGSPAKGTKVRVPLGLSLNATHQEPRKGPRGNAFHLGFQSNLLLFPFGASITLCLYDNITVLQRPIT